MMGKELKPCPFCGHDASVFGVCGVVKVLCSNRRAIDVNALREVVAEIEDADVDGDGDWSERIRKAVGL